MKEYSRNMEVPKTNFYVYFIYLPNEPNPCYIGKGSGKRYTHYKYKAALRNPEFREKIETLFENNGDYLVEIVFETNDELEAFDVESFYIAYYGRQIDKSGILYNYANGQELPVERLQEGRRRPVYIKGFIFPSVSKAVERCGVSKKSIDYNCKVLRASYLDDEEQIKRVSDKERKDFEYLKYSYFYRSRIKSFKLAKKWWKNHFEAKESTKLRRKIEIDGVVYPSITDAAKTFGYKRGHNLTRYLKRGYHNHTYKIYEKGKEEL